MQKYSRQAERINLFVEYVGKDNKGNRIVQDFIHQEIQNHIDECKRQKIQNCGILAPWGHGKTEQVIFRVLHEIGRNQNIRIQYVCNTDDNATSRVQSIKRYIEGDKEYNRVFPWVSPAKGEDWGKHKLIIERDSKAKDGTLEAWGITSSGTGSRADLQLFDDPVDLRNAILNPAMREQIKSSFKNVWIPRLVPDGFRIYIATAWHEADLTHELMKNSEWAFLVMRVSEDFTCIECESKLKGKYKIPLWSSQWSEDKLKKQFKGIGARAFDRGYRQKAINDEDRTFPSSDSIFNESCGKEIILPFWPRIVGIDPFGQAVVIFVIALNPLNHMRFVLEIRRGKWQPKQTVNEIIDVFTVHKPQFLVCENNASQSAISQWVSDKNISIPIIPFNTGAQKADPILGLPSIEVEFANGAWCVPCRGVDTTDADNPINVFRSELRGHPVAESWDTVMAAWFAREGCRLLIEKSENPDPDPNEVLDAEDVGADVEEITIGAY